MNSRLFFALCVALVGLFASQAFADYCLGAPLNIKETHCADVIPCSPGEYCDKSATCVPTKANGATCEEDFECSFGSICRGPENSKICVAIAGVGQACTGDFEVAQSDCSSLLTCDFTTKKCVDGRYGDSCTANSDCRSGVCTASKCVGPVGTECFSDSQFCDPGLFCNFTSGQCTTRVAVGAACLGGECASTAVCLGTSLQPNQGKTCVAKASVVAGGYCGGYSDVCVSGICYNDHCLAKPPTYCTDNDNCLKNQLCLCGKSYLTRGYGKCASFSCASKFTDLFTCLEEQCQTDSLESLDYPNSCASVNCRAAFDAATKCNGVLLGELFGSNPTKKAK